MIVTTAMISGPVNRARNSRASYRKRHPVARYRRATRDGRPCKHDATHVNADGTTIVVVTHDEDLARAARRVVHMRDGVIVSDDRQAPLAGDVPARAAAP